MAKFLEDRDAVFTVAIIGAGISSLCVAVGLRKHPHIKIQIYEARANLDNEGYGFGIGANGQKAMKLIDAELFECLAKAGAVPSSPSSRFMMATGPGAGKHIIDEHTDPPQQTVRRVNLLREIRHLVPSDTIKTERRLLKIEQCGDIPRLSLSFEDGSEEIAHAVIGADGTNSIVRPYVIGNLASMPKWSPGFNMRVVIPMTEAISIFGQEYCDQKCQIGWIGHEGFSLTDMEDDGDAMQVITGFSSNETVAEVYGKPFVPVPKEFWTSRLQSWGWIGQKISEVISRQETVFAASGREHERASAYFKENVCIVGDAACSFPPFLGAGAGQAIEDAMIIATALACVNGQDDQQIARAFQVYDTLRRPRREEVAQRSREQAILATGRAENIGTDVTKLAAALAHRYDFIVNCDLESAKQRALDMMGSPGNLEHSLKISNAGSPTEDVK